mgnify:CR=1 FL=1
MPSSANQSCSDKSFQEYDLNNLPMNMRLEVGVVGGGALVVTKFENAHVLVIDGEECLSEVFVWDAGTISLDTQFVPRYDVQRYLSVGPNEAWRYGDHSMLRGITSIREVDPLKLVGELVRGRMEG